MELKVAIEERNQRREEVAAALRNDWRPMISYTANLQRIGFALIGSQAAWEKLDQIIGLRQKNAPRRIEMEPDSTVEMMVPQYPWYWSALVLLALGGISVWILHKRVTSLDRLR